MTSEGRDGGLEYLLPGYINDRLTPEQRWQVDAWLDSNPQVMQQLRSWRQIHTALQGRPVRTPPTRIWLALERRVLAAILVRNQDTASPPRLLPT
jgi:anti-sigma factor RsiW